MNMLCRDDAFSYGDEVYFMENNKPKKSTIEEVSIRESSDGVRIRYKIDGQHSKYKIPHKKVAKTKDHLSQKIFGS